MLRTGKEHLERLRDGRVIYIGSERVDDVTAHPAFRNAARTIASIYDMKADPAHAEAMSFVENGRRYSMYFLQARTAEDLRRRMRCHKAIADLTYGMFGRSPDHVASYVTAMAMNPQVFDSDTRTFSANVRDYYRHTRDNDNY